MITSCLHLTANSYKKFKRKLSFFDFLNACLLFALQTVPLQKRGNKKYLIMHTMGSKWVLVGCHFENPSRAHNTSTSKRV